MANAIIAATALATPLLSLASPSPVPVALSGLSLILIVVLLWRSDAPPILILPVLFQWSEVAVLPLATVWKQTPLNQFSLFGADLEMSAAYGLAGVTALALGLRIGVENESGPAFNVRLATEAAAWSSRDAFRIALSAMCLGYMLSALTSIAGPARELVGNAASIKFVGIFIITYWCLVNRKYYGILVAILAFDVVYGMTGFFAAFKNTVLTLVVAALAARPRLRPSDLGIAFSAAATLLLIATFWTAIKGDYRLRLNEGTGAQVVNIPVQERLDHLLGAVWDLDSAKMSDGFDRLVRRHGYIEFLALVMRNVPEALPHENGALTRNVVSHITMPRFLFPSKPPLPSDTEVMAKYTGLPFTWNEHTSISIGNLGELYIDFGLFGGLVAEIVIGILIALAYRSLSSNHNCPALISAGLCVAVVLPAAYFGTAYIKLIGAFVFTSAIAISVQRFLLPRLSTIRSLPRSRMPGWR